MLKITLVKSTNKVVAKQKATVTALGLKKIGSFVEKQDNAQVRGMINVVSHLVKVEEI
ncbi:MAG: 50S ribosomal protein L30 [Clostridia bacterium]|nr:50S ribosomal protein L30 [Clostridia bacterium]